MSGLLQTRADVACVPRSVRQEVAPAFADRARSLPHPQGRGTVLVVASLTRSLVNFRRELLEAIVAAGYRVVATAPDDDPETVAALTRAGVAFVRIPLARAGLNPFGDALYLARLSRLMRRVRPVAVVPYTAKPVIYSGIASRVTGTGRLFPLMTGLGYVFSDHDMDRRREIVRTITVRLYRAALKRSERIFVYNAADRADMTRHAFVADTGRLCAVPGSGINLDAFPQVPVPSGRIVFLMIARLLRDKGVFQFLQAARAIRASHPDVSFRLLGPLDLNPTALSAQELESWVADGTVEYLGETLDVRPHLADCTAFVLPTYYREGIPRTLLEALATGRPVITTDTAGCRETVIPGENGFLVPPRDASALEEAMLRLVKKPAMAELMGRRSRMLAQERFDVHAVNHSLLTRMGLVGPQQRG